MIVIFLTKQVGIYYFGWYCCFLLFPVSLCDDLSSVPEHQCKEVNLTKHECHEEEILHGKQNKMLICKGNHYVKNYRFKKKHELFPFYQYLSRLFDLLLIFQGLIFRFKFLMLLTLLCAALTVVFFIMSQLSEGKWKWGDDNISLEYSSAFFTGMQ